MPVIPIPDPDYTTCLHCQADLEDTIGEHDAQEWPAWLNAGCCCHECHFKLDLTTLINDHIHLNQVGPEEVVTMLLEACPGILDHLAWKPSATQRCEQLVNQAIATMNNR